MSTTLKLDDKTARKLYPSAIPEFKTILEESFPKGFFNQSIIDRTPTIDDIFSIAGTTLEEIIKPGDSKDEIAYKVIKLGISVLREGKKVDYSDANQIKYEPRFIHRSGVGLSYDYYGHGHTITYCGPRLCYLSYESMMHGIKVMDKYYNDYLN